MLAAFLLTYAVARGYTRIARRTGWGSASFGGVHTHHMVFGMVMAFVSAALVFSLLPPQGPLLNLLAAVFGSGAALVLDEFALFFHLEDVYWEKEGRKSVDAIVLATAIGSMFLMRLTPLNLGSDYSGWVLAVVVAIDVVSALVAALKGKIYFALFGVFIPTLAQVGAVRLAEPESMWARRFYPTGSAKFEKSKKRYAAYEKRWRHRKEQLWDIIGGKTGRPVSKSK